MIDEKEPSLVSAGQRRINIIWEVTQAVIAIMVVFTFLIVSSKLVLSQTSDMVAFVVLSNVVALVIGFYFGRTNHTKTGGIGSQSEGR